jgi:hypothetical protein
MGAFHRFYGDFKFPAADHGASDIPGELEGILVGRKATRAEPKRKTSPDTYLRVASDFFVIGDFVGRGSTGYVYDAVRPREGGKALSYREESGLSHHGPAVVKVCRTFERSVASCHAEFTNMMRMVVKGEQSGIGCPVPISFTVCWDARTRNFWAFILMSKLKGETP